MWRAKKTAFRLHLLNVGLSKVFKQHFTVDVRYWDTDVDGDPLADERIVGTISFSY